MDTRISVTRRSLSLLLLTFALLGMAIGLYAMHANVLTASLVVSEYKPPPGIGSTADLLVRLGIRPERTQLPAPLSDAIGGFLNGRIKNGSARPLKGVTLAIPTFFYVCVQRGTTAPICRSSVNDIQIASMKPFESVVLQIWLPYKPNITVYREIKLLHSQGGGKVTLKAVELPPGLIRGNYITVIFVTGLILYVLHIYLARRYAQKQLAVPKSSSFAQFDTRRNQ
jgi:hypothetical protein